MEECCQYFIEIESTIGADLNDVYLEIDTCTRPILVSDLPNEIPIDLIVGNLPVDRIDGLDDYLDSYEFDCGTP